MSSSICVLVHGVPESDVIWDPLDAALTANGVEVVRLSPPGFGAPLPAGFAVDAESYCRWLIEELATLESDTGPTTPIDIVGHDWGAGHVFRLAATRPTAVRSWAADIGGLLHPDYVWHDTAKAWQTPKVGEEVIDAMVAAPSADQVALYVGLGFTEAMAVDLAEAMNEDMGRAILGLYRSSKEPELRALADLLVAADSAPGLIITATDDPYVAADLARPVAQRLGVDELVLDGQGHWWMVSDAERAANGLVSFWASL